jgi:hypothetical protein
MKPKLFVFLIILLIVLGLSSTYWLPIFLGYLTKNEITIQTLEAFIQIIYLIGSIIFAIYGIGKLNTNSTIGALNMTEQPFTSSSNERLLHKYNESKIRWKDLSAQIEAINLDLGIESDNFRKRNLKERKALLDEERNAISLDLDRLERLLDN